MVDEKGRFIKGHHWRKEKPHWNKEWLFNEYITKKHTIPELAIICDCTDSNISYWIDKHKIPFRSISETRSFKYWGSSGDVNGMFGVRGDSNPNWKGGISPDRQVVYNSQEWKEIVPLVFVKCDYKCLRCGDTHKSNKNPLHIHHLVSFEISELRIEINNLIVLCRKCHHWVHSRKNSKKEYILTYEQFKLQK